MDDWNRKLRTLYTWSHLYLGFKVAQVRSRMLPEQQRAAYWKGRHSKFAQAIWMNIADLRGWWVKVGQFLSTRADLLPDEYVSELQKVQDMMPTSDFEIIKPIIEAELGKTLQEIFEVFEEKAIASASIGQVHKAKLRENHEWVVVKVQHPNVDRLLSQDMKLLTQLSWAFGLLERGLNFTAVLEEWNKQASKELDFKFEMQNQMRVREACKAANLRVKIPYCYAQYTSKKVLVMEFTPGFKSTDHEKIKEYGINVDELCTLITESFAYQIHNLGLFNGDPHPGNIMVEVDKTTGEFTPVLLDWGLVKEFDRIERLAFAKFIVAVANADVMGLMEAFIQMGFKFKPTAKSKADEEKLRKGEKPTKKKDDSDTPIPIDPEIYLDAVTVMFGKEQGENQVTLSENDRRLMMAKASEKNVGKNINKTIQEGNPLDDWPKDIIFFLRVASLLHGLSVQLKAKVPFFSILLRHAEAAAREQYSVPYPYAHYAFRSLFSHPSPERILKPPVRGWRSVLEWRLHKFMSVMTATGELLGAQVSVWHKNTLIVDVAVGRMGPYDSRPVTSQSLFVSFSLSNILLILMLLDFVNQGKLELTDCVSEWWDQYIRNEKRGISVEQLLTHQSGVHSFWPSNLTLAQMTSFRHMIRLLEAATPVCPPGHCGHYAYAQVSYAYYGLVAAVSKMKPGKCLKVLLLKQWRLRHLLKSIYFPIPHRIVTTAKNVEAKQKVAVLPATAPVPATSAKGSPPKAMSPGVPNSPAEHPPASAPPLQVLETSPNVGAPDTATPATVGQLPVDTRWTPRRAAQTVRAFVQRAPIPREDHNPSLADPSDSSASSSYSRSSSLSPASTSTLVDTYCQPLDDVSVMTRRRGCQNSEGGRSSDSGGESGAAAATGSDSFERQASPRDVSSVRSVIVPESSKMEVTVDDDLMYRDLYDTTTLVDLPVPLVRNSMKRYGTHSGVPRPRHSFNQPLQRETSPCVDNTHTSPSLSPPRTPVESETSIFLTDRAATASAAEDTRLTDSQIPTCLIQSGIPGGSNYLAAGSGRQAASPPAVRATSADESTLQPSIPTFPNRAEVGLSVPLSKAEQEAIQVMERLVTLKRELGIARLADVAAMVRDGLSTAPSLSETERQRQEETRIWREDFQRRHDLPPKFVVASRLLLSKYPKRRDPMEHFLREDLKQKSKIAQLMAKLNEVPESLSAIQLLFRRPHLMDPMLYSSRDIAPIELPHANARITSRALSTLMHAVTRGHIIRQQLLRAMCQPRTYDHSMEARIAIGGMPPVFGLGFQLLPWGRLAERPSASVLLTRSVSPDTVLPKLLREPLPPNLNDTIHAQDQQRQGCPSRLVATTRNVLAQVTQNAGTTRTILQSQAYPKVELQPIERFQYDQHGEWAGRNTSPSRASSAQAGGGGKTINWAPKAPDDEKNESVSSSAAFSTGDGYSAEDTSRVGGFGFGCSDMTGNLAFSLPDQELSICILVNDTMTGSTVAQSILEIVMESFGLFVVTDYRPRGSR